MPTPPISRGIFPDLTVNFQLSNPYVIVGLLLGALLPYLFGAMGMTAVGRAAGEVVKDVRDQFATNPGIMTFDSKPDYARTVDLVTKAAIKEMIVPSLLPVLSPILVYYVITGVAGQKEGFAALGAMLLGRHRLGAVRRHLDDVAAAARGTMPRNISRTATTAARARKRTRRRSPATPWATRTRIRRARR